MPEAATVLGVTVDAVRGRMRRGTIASEHDEHGKVYVWVDVPEADRLGPSEASQGPSIDREELVESLLEQVRYMREQLAAEREANRENRRLLAAALERIPAIEPPETTHGPETSAEPRPGTDTPADAGEVQEGVERRSWWRRLFGG